MKIDASVTRKVAHLARIAVKEEEVDAISEELSKILTFMDTLNELDTENVKPLVYMNESENVWREDTVGGVLPTSEGLKNAPSKKETYFTVPKILEK